MKKALLLAALLIGATAAARTNAPCFALDPLATWPPASASLTNHVPVSFTNEFDDWHTLRLSWRLQASTYYEVQFSTNAEGPWLLYADVQLYLNSVHTVWYPIYCGESRFVRVMR